MFALTECRSYFKEMVRRTKEEAAATRDSILDAAEILFAKQGVSRTTLQHIATAAGVTRGAIYWHFVDKGALYSAMMDRATMPMDTAVKLLDEREIADPLQRLRDELMAVPEIVVSDDKARRVFEIATLKTEFTEEVDSARVRKREAVAEWRGRMHAQLAKARENGQLPAGVDPGNAATCMWIMLDGLLRNWLFDHEPFDLLALGGEVIDTFLAGLKAR